MSDTLRGHTIILIGEEWYYEDTRERTAGNQRPCGYCGAANTEEGHDGCLGKLPNVANACCGHGKTDEAYVQLLDGTCIRGQAALCFVAKTKASANLTGLLTKE